MKTTKSKLNDSSTSNKRGHIWFLIKHIFKFMIRYNEKDEDEYILFCSTLKYHDRELKRMSRLKHETREYDGR